MYFRVLIAFVQRPLIFAPVMEIPINYLKKIAYIFALFPGIPEPH